MKILIKSVDRMGSDETVTWSLPPTLAFLIQATLLFWMAVHFGLIK